MKDTQQHWGTWTADKPVELSHLPTGFRITPVLYSARANHASAIPPGELVRFGPRTFNDRSIRFDTTHEDTRLRWQYTQSDTSDLAMHWHCSENGEWGLRYWVNLCVSAPPGIGFRFDRENARLTSDNNTGLQLSVLAEKPPLMVTFHECLAALIEEYAEKGYFYLGSRGTSGQFAVLRFNLEEAPTLTCHVQLLSAEAPVSHADSLTLPLVTSHPESPGSLQSRSSSDSPISSQHALSNAPDLDDLVVAKTPQAALQAIYDVIAWNHVFDPINERSYTVLTRFWNQQKFGGFGIWMNDVMYHALLWSRYDKYNAQCNIDAVFTWQTDEGNFPCLITGNDAWLDRSQPPVVSYVIWCCYRASQNHQLLSDAYAGLLANYDWWWRRRSLHDTGLVAYGTSLDVGDGLYKGTKLAAKDESSMDNMAVHDPADFDANTGLIQAADVGLNSLLALDGEILAQMAVLLDHPEDASRLQKQVASHKARIGEWLWDEKRGVFANRMIDGRFVQPLAPTSFFPMAAGIATDAQIESMISRYLNKKDKFGGHFVLPSASRDDPAYNDNVYWRGRIWAPLNYWVYEGLRRNGRETEASTLADKSQNLFNQGWQHRQCGENYHAESGAITDQADSDTFYTWGALLPALVVKEVIDDTPWHGLSLWPARAGKQFGPVNTVLGALSIRSEKTHWCIDREGRSVLTGTLAGSLKDVIWNADCFSASIAVSTSTQTLTDCETLTFIGLDIASARIEQHQLTIDNVTVIIPATHPGGRLQITFC